MLLPPAAHQKVLQPYPLTKVPWWKIKIGRSCRNFLLLRPNQRLQAATPKLLTLSGGGKASGGYEGSGRYIGRPGNADLLAMILRTIRGEECPWAEAVKVCPASLPQKTHGGTVGQLGSQLAEAMMNFVASRYAAKRYKRCPKCSWDLLREVISRVRLMLTRLRSRKPAILPLYYTAKATGSGDQDLGCRLRQCLLPSLSRRHARLNCSRRIVSISCNTGAKINYQYYIMGPNSYSNY